MEFDSSSSGIQFNAFSVPATYAFGLFGAIKFGAAISSFREIATIVPYRGSQRKHHDNTYLNPSYDVFGIHVNVGWNLSATKTDLVVTTNLTLLVVAN
ncbi:hypothetical protein DEO72_LG11g1436 [Vigna unguiculata]|uniref:Uncharacterized protein n=1 Tax=Vigna unguiculata TaxID=3917 RepID=A0A4D6NLC2_VIGUN|nr:hypothetical protein DEO72_LG11g1436 [Vigna unguiculata]